VRVVSCIATLTTDANVANRLFSLDYISGRATTAIRNSAAAVYTANTSATVFQWDHAHAVSDWGTGTPVFVPLVDLIFVRDADHFDHPLRRRLRRRGRIDRDPLARP
jgi:hypothetical protein